MNDVLLRLLLIIVAGVVAYRVISKRRSSRKDKIRWKGIVDEELEHLKKVVPVEHYINLLALSRSEMTDQECIARLEEIAETMREKNVDAQPVNELVQKISNSAQN